MKMLAVFLSVEHSFEIGGLRIIDGPRWKSWVLVCVVRAVHFPVDVQHPPNGKVTQRINQGGIRLKAHATAQPVEVQPRYRRGFVQTGGFRFGRWRPRCRLLLALAPWLLLERAAPKTTIFSTPSPCGPLGL